MPARIVRWVRITRRALPRTPPRGEEDRDEIPGVWGRYRARDFVKLTASDLVVTSLGAASTALATTPRRTETLPVALRERRMACAWRTGATVKEADMADMFTKKLSRVLE